MSAWGDAGAEGDWGVKRVFLPYPGAVSRGIFVAAPQQTLCGAAFAESLLR